MGVRGCWSKWGDILRHRGYVPQADLAWYLLSFDGSDFFLLHSG